MGNGNDLIEWRRFGHWRTSAAKTRYSAFLLWKLRSDPWIETMADECHHKQGDGALAVMEAFNRESAIALELIVKAVIAQNLQDSGVDTATVGVPATHDVPKLWNEASLPVVSNEDMHRLQLAKSTLMWAGRYATPRSGKAWDEEIKAFRDLETPPSDASKIIFRKPITIGWSEFDRLYQIAAQKLR